MSDCLERVVASAEELIVRHELAISKLELEHMAGQHRLAERFTSEVADCFITTDACAQMLNRHKMALASAWSRRQQALTQHALLNSRA